MSSVLEGPATPRPARRLAILPSIPFFAVHGLAIAGVAWLGFSWKGVALAVGLYYLRMFGITAGYHRYFSHRSFRCGRAVQFFFALLGASAVQKGPIWWAAHHRGHHKNSDGPEDVHSVRQHGFLWAHVGWILSDAHDETDWKRVPDLARFPELRFLNRHYYVVPVALGLLLWFVLGPFGFVWGFLVSTVLLWHGTFAINSLAHLVGRRRYATDDDSKNSFLLALLTLGEGWHNNHHHYQRATCQGFFWWELDVSFLVLRAMEKVGLVSGLHRPPPHALYAHLGGKAPSEPAPASSQPPTAEPARG